MQKSSLARSSLIVIALTLAANLTGFAARMVIAAKFGNGPEVSAFRTAFNIPDLLFNLLAGGALGSAFIPVFAGRLGGAQWTHAWRLVARIALTATLVMAAFALLAAWRAPWLVGTFSSADAPPAVKQLIVQLMRVMLISTVIFSVSGLLMGVLQSNGSFLAPALAAVLYNVGMALGAWLLGDWLGIFGAAVGVVFGALLHLLVQLPALRTAYTRTRPSADIATPELQADVRAVLHAMPLRMIGSGAVYFNNIVRDGIAIGFPSGVSTLNSAFAIMILPQAAIAQAISTALFPTISMHAARGDRSAFGQALSQAISVIVGLSVPAAAGLIVLGQPLIAILLQRGAFTGVDTRQVGLALSMYALGLVAHCVLEIVTRAFYALKENKVPVFLAVASMIINIALSFLLLPLFEPLTDFPFIALALANTVATTVETLAMYWLLVRRVPEISHAGVVREIGKAALGACAMTAMITIWFRVASDTVFATVIALLLGIGMFIFSAVLLRSDLVTFGRRVLSRGR